jgi:hypothetical protein
MSQQNVESMRRSYEAFNLALSTGDDLRPLMENIDLAKYGKTRTPPETPIPTEIPAKRPDSEAAAHD